MSSAQASRFVKKNKEKKSKRKGERRTVEAYEALGLGLVVHRSDEGSDEEVDLSDAQNDEQEDLGL